VSWHYLQGQEVASWEGCSLAGAPSALLSLIPTPDPCCSQDRPTDALTDSQSGMTCGPLTGDNGPGPLTSSLEDSPARTLAPQAKAPVCQESGADFGPKWPGSLARFDHGSRSWKTRQCLLLGGLESFSGTWPRWGTMRDGEFWEQPTPGRRTKEIGSGSWDTPCKGDAHPRAYKRKGPYLGKGQEHLQSQCYKRFRSELDSAGGILSPLWVEWLMGWPMGWTDLRALATDKFQQWCDLHGRP